MGKNNIRVSAMVKWDWKDAVVDELGSGAVLLTGELSLAESDVLFKYSADLAQHPEAMPFDIAE